MEIKQSGLYDPRADHTMPTSRERKEQDLIILHETLIELFFMTQIEETPVLDELTSGLASVVSDKTCAVWMTFGAQILVHIHNALGEDVGLGFSELQAFGTHIASVFKEYYKSSKSGPFAQLAARKEPTFDSLRGLIDRWIVGDSLDQFKRKFIRPPVQMPLEPFSLFRCHPLICGLFQFQLYTSLQHHSINLAEK